ncbi:MAG: hypothetical protein CSB34_04060 [Desulfobulbus propionicus]|nr:MAG: hypothetical protein CSB34_04060 [Desulfobulbus propionicus]
MISCTERMQEEVSTLLGKSIILGKPDTAVLSKEQFFEQIDGKKVLAHTQFEGDLEGAGGLVLSLKDAIRIGGTLIMLPESELQTVISEENYSEEIKDAYGEIANIICGSITSTLEEQHPKKFRVVRTEQEVIIPTKVEIASDQPFPDTRYFICSLSMKMESTEMGMLNIVFPAEPLRLVEDGAADVGATADTGSAPDTAQSASAEAPQEEPSPQPVVDTKALGKRQKQIDGLFKLCFDKIEEEVSTLIGGKLTLSGQHQELCTKEELLEQLEGKQVMANLEVRGVESSDSYLFIKLPAAIRLGGSLIMLPEAELDEAVRNEDFVEDAQDAYEEIANIIAGIYTAVFEEQYKEKIGFVKTDTETITPVKIDLGGDDLLPKQLYYVTSGTIEFNGNELGRLQTTFPATLFGLEGLAQSGGADEAQAQPAGSEKAEQSEIEQSTSSAFTDAQGEATTPTQTVAEQLQVADIVLFSDDEEQSTSISNALKQLGYTPHVQPFKSNVNNAITSAVQLVFIVMREVNEQGFGVGIKVSNCGFSMPVVVCGPAWTRSLVIKAVKYGADDILVTPATADEVREKVEMNLSKIAA